MANKKGFVARHGVIVNGVTVIDANGNVSANALSSGIAADLNTKASWAALLATNTAIRSVISTEVAGLVDSAPATLDTLNELAAALGDDANYAATIATSLATKASNAAFQSALANTNAYIATKMDSSGGSFTGTVNAGHIIPTANNTYDLGSANMVWRDVYIGPGSLYVNGTKVIEDDSDTIVVKADPDQSLTVKTTGTGETTLQSEGGVNVTATGTSDVQITASSGNIELKGTTSLLSGKRIIDSAGTQVEFGDNIEMNSNKITGVGTPVNTGDAATKGYVDSADSTLSSSISSLTSTVASNLANTNAYISSVDANAKTRDGDRLGATASITLAGDLSGSASFSANAMTLTATVADDSHNHIISNVDGLQTALNNKMSVANTIALANARLGAAASVALTGAVTGSASFSGNSVSITTTATSDPTLTLNGDVSGSATFTNLGNATLTATVADDSHNHSSSSGAFTVGTDLTVSGGDITLSGTGRIQGVDTVSAGTDAANKTYVDTAISNLVDSAPATLDTLNELAAALGDDPNFATTLTTNLGQRLGAAASITLAGDVSGSGSFSSNAVSITCTVADDSHNHIIGNVDGLQTALDAKALGATTISAGTGLTGGGSLAANRTISLSHLGIQNLSDPDADRIMMWDDSAGAVAWMTAGSNLSISGTTLSSTDTNTTYSAGNGVSLSGTTFSVAAGTGLTQQASGLALSHLGIQSLSDPGADRIMFWDDSAGAMKWLSAGSNMSISGTSLNSSYTDTNTTYSAGTGLGLSGTTFSLSHLGIQSLSDPNADRIMFWDDSAGAMAWLSAGSNLSISGTSLNSSYTDTNTTYTADGNYGLTLSGTTFRLEDDRRRNSSSTDIYSGNTHDYTFYDASHGIRWYTAGSEEMRLENDGDLHVDGDVVAYSTTVSDERLKENIVGIDDALNKVLQLNGYTFSYKADGKVSAGVIAQEVEKVLPEAVAEKGLPYKADDDQMYKVVTYDALHGLLIEAIKEQQAMIDELKAKIG